MLVHIPLYPRALAKLTRSQVTVSLVDISQLLLELVNFHRREMVLILQAMAQSNFYLMAGARIASLSVCHSSYLHSIARPVFWLEYITLASWQKNSLCNCSGVGVICGRILSNTLKKNSGIPQGQITKAWTLLNPCNQLMMLTHSWQATLHDS